jgi:hypothetical protein
VAFWVRTSEGGLWHLIIASPEVDEERPNVAYRKLYASLDKLPSSWVTPADVTLLNEQNSIARAAIEVSERYPAPLPTNHHGKRLGDLAIKEAYIYPAIGAPRLSFTVTYQGNGNPNNWTATTQRGRLLRDLRAKGAVSYSTARWGGETEADQRFANVSVLVEIDPRFDDPAVLDLPDRKRMTADQARRMADEMFRSHHPDAVIEQDRDEEEDGNSPRA